MPLNTLTTKIEVIKMNENYKEKPKSEYVIYQNQKIIRIIPSVYVYVEHIKIVKKMLKIINQNITNTKKRELING